VRTACSSCPTFDAPRRRAPLRGFRGGLLRHVGGAPVLDQRDQHVHCVAVVGRAVDFGHAIDRQQAADVRLLQIADAAALGQCELGIGLGFARGGLVVTELFGGRPLRGLARAQLLDVRFVVELFPEHQLQHVHGVVLAAFAAQHAPVVHDRQHARFHGRGRFRRRERPPRADPPRGRQLVVPRLVLRGQRDAVEETAHGPLVDPPGHVRVNGGVRHGALKGVQPLQLFDQQLRARHVRVVALIAEVLFGFVVGPLARAHQQIDVRHAVELGLLVEQRLDPVFAVAVAPEIFQPLLAIVRMPHDLARQRRRAEQRRTVQLVHMPRRRRRAARVDDGLERSTDQAGNTERANDALRQFLQPIEVPEVKREEVR
jgi:hypothetical protein